MNRKQLIAAIIWVIVIAAVAIAGVAAYYTITVPDKKVVLGKASSDRVWALLKEANYVSPNYPAASGSSRAVYLITYKGCKACAAYENSEFPKLRAAGVDTRVYVFTPPAVQPPAGQTKVDNAAIVELWLNRDWALYQRWINDPKFTGDGVPPADDMARKYVLMATKDFYTEILAELPAKKPTDLHAPFVIVADKDGKAAVCFCDVETAYHHASDAFGLQGTGQPSIPTFELPKELPKIPGFGKSSGNSASSAAKSSAAPKESDFGPEN
jgi:hypothetical protein